MDLFTESLASIFNILIIILVKWTSLLSKGKSGKENLTWSGDKIYSGKTELFMRSLI